MAVVVAGAEFLLTPYVSCIYFFFCVVVAKRKKITSLRPIHIDWMIEDLSCDWLSLFILQVCCFSFRSFSSLVQCEFKACWLYAWMCLVFAIVGVTFFFHETFCWLPLFSSSSVLSFIALLVSPFFRVFGCMVALKTTRIFTIHTNFHYTWSRLYTSKTLPETARTHSQSLCGC